MDIIKIYNDNKNSVYRLALTYMHSEAEAEDICHDVFVKLIENQNFVYEGKEKNWLLKVTANECRNRLRFFKRFEKAIELDQIADRNEEMKMFDISMELGIKERTAVYLYYYEGYSTEEMAKILEISASAVRSRLERARKHLKEKLEGEL